MNPLIIQGLILSLTGLALTFASLGLLVVILTLLQRFFSPQPPLVLDETALDEPDNLPTATAVPLPTEEVAAAIAAALTYLSPSYVPPESQLGSLLKTGPGHWWRRSQLQTRRWHG